MGVLDDINKQLEEQYPDYEPGSGAGRSNWVDVCMCGHLRTTHSERIGGDMPVMPGASLGCRGAFQPRNMAASTMMVRVDGDLREAPTCPCEEFHAVARSDRAHAAFRQKVPKDGRVHPFLLGLKAFATWLGNRKSVADPAKALDERFEWIEDARKCEVCGRTGDTVWPVFIDSAKHTGMRCDMHWKAPFDV